MGRSSIAVSDEIASRLSRVAESEDKTSYALANECLDAALKVCENGGNPDEIYFPWIMNRVSKDVGAFQWVGRSLLERLAKDFGKLDSEKFSRIWYDAGFSFGVYLQICFPRIEDVISLEKQLNQAGSFGRVKFVHEPATFGEEKNVTSFSLDLVLPYSEELLTFLSEYMRGLYAAYGLTVVESKITAGALRLKFVSKGKLLKADPSFLK